MTNEEVAWVAGVIEGEGCIDLNRNDGRYPRIRVQMGDVDVVRRLHEVTGVGTFRLDDIHNRRNPKWSKMAIWSVYKRNDVVPLLEAIRPWMGDRRRARIDEVLTAPG